MYIRKGYKILCGVIVPTLIFAQAAMAAPSSIYYQDASNNMILANYQTAMLNKVQNNPDMYNALSTAFLNAETNGRPIFITDDTGKVINWAGALNASEDYTAALSDPNVNQATIPVATEQMNADGTVTSVTPAVTIQSVSAINVTTVAGTAPVLPATVSATMSDKTTSMVAVAWGTLTASQYATAGTFVVTGSVGNPAVPAIAIVTVNGDGTRTISALAVTGQLVGTGALNTPAVATVNTGVTVSGSVYGAGAANTIINYLVSTSSNITAKDSNGNTLVATYFDSPIIVGNDVFEASYAVPSDASGNVKAIFTSTASSQQSFKVVVEAPFINNGQPIRSNEASIEWGAPGTIILSPISNTNIPHNLSFSTPGQMKGLMPVEATIVPATGSSTVLSGQAISFTMATQGYCSPDANAYFTDSTGVTVASSVYAGNGGSSTITCVVNTDANGQALVYINANLPTNNLTGLADLGAIMSVGVQAQLVNGGESTNVGYYQWKAAAQPTQIGNVSPAAMLNPTGINSVNSIVAINAETAVSGSQITISGTVEDSVGNPVSGATIAIQDYDVINGISNNVQNDAYVANGTTTLFSAVNYPVVTTDSKGNFSVVVTANVPITQSVVDSVTRYYAYYIPPTIVVTSGLSLPPTAVTSLAFMGDNNFGNFINLVWEQA
ncbi:MAG: Ig-like domain-containing protein [Desulfosporosinus sp.]|nr:Ig-like domain-containing protein [Desulfosporosinus sp.]